MSARRASSTRARSYATSIASPGLCAVLSFFARFEASVHSVAQVLNVVLKNYATAPHSGCPW